MAHHPRVSGNLAQPGNFGESQWMPADDAVKVAMDGAGILEQTPIPYRVMG